MNTKLLHRLVWKELRSLRALWLTLLAAAIVLQLGPTGFFEFWRDRGRWLCGVMLVIPTIYALASASLTFAGEREEGTDQLLCRLATPPGMLLGVKFGLSVLTTAALFGVLASWTMLLLKLVDRSDHTWSELTGDLPKFSIEALAWTTGLLSFGLFFSLLFRRVLPCLVATAVAAGLLPLITTNLLDLVLSSKAPWTDWLDWMLRLGVVPVLTLVISTWFVGNWDENRWPRLLERLLEAWRNSVASRDRPNPASGIVGWLGHRGRTLLRPFGLFLSDGDLSAWRREVRRWLWLERRQVWRVMLFVSVAFGIYVAEQQFVVRWGSQLLTREFPFVMAFVAFLFGAMSFQAQQSGQRFRDFAAHGASPTALWGIKQVVWFSAMLLTTGVLTLLVVGLDDLRQSEFWPAFYPGEIEELWRPLGFGINWKYQLEWIPESHWLPESSWSLLANVVVALGLSFGVGQLVSLLIPRAVTAATVGFLLAGVAFTWQQSTASVAIPSGLAVLPLIVGLLAASAVRMADWLEERNSVRGWLRVLAACFIPSLVTLIGTPIYRVAEIPMAEIPTGSHGEIERPELLSEKPAWMKADTNAKRVAEWWLRLAESIEGEPVFVSKSTAPASDGGESVEIESERRPRHLMELRTELVAWSKLKNRDWLSTNADRVSEMLRLAPHMENCAFDNELFEGSGTADNRLRRFCQVAVLLKMASESAISEGKLGEGLRPLLVLLRLSEHMQQNAQWWATYSGEQLEQTVWTLLIDWVRHPAQTGDSLRAAIGRSATAHPLAEALKKHVELLPPPSQVVVEEYSIAKQESAKRRQEFGWPVSWLFWERQRYERLLDYSVVAAMQDMHIWLPVSRENWQGDRQLVFRPIWHQPRQSPQRMRAHLLQRSTWNPIADRDLRFLWGYDAEWQHANERGEASAWRRGLIATLALRAFHLDHGRWPAQWDELIGAYLDRVPVDPWTGLPFEFRPQGFPFELRTWHSRIPANTPLFTSRGTHEQRLEKITVPSGEGEPEKTEWVAVSPYQTQPWPPKDEEHSGSLSLLAFPLTAESR